MQLKEIVKKQNNLTYLEDLPKAEVAAKDVDVRNFEVSTESGVILGKVSDLVVNTSEKKVKYVELNMDKILSNADSPILAQIDGEDIFRKSYVPGDHYTLVPVGIVDVHEEQEQITIPDNLAKNVFSARQHRRKSTITSEYEANIVDKYSNSEEVNLQNTMSESMFDKGLIRKKGNRQKRLFHNHYFSYKM